MSVIRSLNVLGQMRVDCSHLRAVESAINYDFDLMAGTVLAGQKPLIVKGFTITATNTVGSNADTLQMNVADSILLHYGASESGTLYITPSDATTELLSTTNANVTGAFSASSYNYVGLDYYREKDTDTSDLTKFLDIDSTSETSQIVPQARILKYQIIITTLPFSSATNIAPIAIVETDSSNNIVSVQDARAMFFRLGSGGDNVDPAHGFDWADSDRLENPSIYTGLSGYTYDPFSGGDKEISSLKDWMDAMMTCVWEARGGTYWYSPANRDNIKVLYGDRVNAENSDNFYLDLGTTLTWKGLRVVFENGGTAYYNDINDGTGDMVNGQCLYVDLDRSQNLTSVAPGYTTGGINAVIGNLVSIGYSAIPGRRYIIAWMSGGNVHCRDKAYSIDRLFPVATALVSGTVKLTGAALDVADPLAVPVGANGVVAYTNATTAGFGVSAFAGTGKAGAGAGAGGDGISGTGGAAPGIGSGGMGLVGTGGASVGGGGGHGIYGIGGAGVAGGYGVLGWGDADGYGVSGRGGLTDGSTGIYGTSAAANGNGVAGQGTGTGVGAQGLGGGTDGSIGVTGSSMATNGNGVSGTGTGTGYGVKGTGGATSGKGLYGVGGAPNGIGVDGLGDGSGAGIKGQGGHSQGIGVHGIGGADAGGPTSGGAGVYGVGGVVGGIGVEGLGDDIGAGVKGTGGPDSGTGVHGVGGAPNGYGVYGSASGLNPAVSGVNSSSGVGVEGVSTTGYGVTAKGDTANPPSYSAFRIVPQAAAPTNALIGDMYVTTTGVLYICTAIGPVTWTKVGAQ